MVTVAAVAVGSSTYAWFVASNTVTATGMQVQAQAEGGIEISNSNLSDAKWGTTANSTITDSTILYPTSTKDLSVWYHAQAQSAGAKTAINDTYEVLNLSDTGIGNGGETDKYNGKQFYLVNSFYIRSTAGTTASNLMINKVDVNTTDNDTTALDKSLRVAIQIGANTTIYSPNEGDTRYQVWDGVTSGEAPSANVEAKDGKSPVSTGTNTITSANPTLVKIFVWYEGEDTNHFSNNLANNVDKLNVTVQFTATTQS